MCSKMIKLIFLATLVLMAAAVAQPATLTALYSFKGTPDGSQPYAGVTLGANGKLYGTTYVGGANNEGTIFQLVPPATAGNPWVETVLYSFKGPDGSNPVAALSFGPSGDTGALFGTTVAGGTGPNSGGIVFELTPPAVGGETWAETVLYSFSGGGPSGHYGTGYPSGKLLVQSNGIVYGTTHGGCIVGPVLYPSAVFALAPPTAPGGGWAGSAIFSFGSGADGYCPSGGVVAYHGALYGTAYYGGDFGCGIYYGCGTAYSLSPPTVAGGTWTATLLHEFSGHSQDGQFPATALTPGPDGVFYGTTYIGGTGAVCAIGLEGGGCGTVFQLTPPATPGGTWTETVLYSFTGVNGDGAFPAASVVVGRNGSLYGTTKYGGSATSGSPCTNSGGLGVSGCGTVFELTPPAAPGGAWAETVLYSFSGLNGDGASPGDLLLSPAGLLYGTTFGGGSGGAGMVYSIAPD